VFAVAWRPEFLATHWQERLLLTTAVTFRAGCPPSAGQVYGEYEARRIIPSILSGPAVARSGRGRRRRGPVLAHPEFGSRVPPREAGFRSVLLAATLGRGAAEWSRAFPYPHVVNQIVKKMSPYVLVFAVLAAIVMLAVFGGVAISVGFWVLRGCGADGGSGTPAAPGEKPFAARLRAFSLILLDPLYDPPIIVWPQHTFPG